VVERILSPADPRVADYRGVSEPERLRVRDLFIAEGRLVVSRLLGDPRWTVRSVLVSDAALRDLEPALRAVAGRVEIFTCAATDFLGITGHDIHRGCLALVERPQPLDLAAALEHARLIVVLEGVANPDNVGGVFRNAAAFGCDFVVLSPSCCSPLYRKAVRTSMAATLRVPFLHLQAGWPAVLDSVRASGFLVAALTLRERSEALADFAERRSAGRLAIVVGAEGRGLSPAVEALADHRVHIPIAPAVDSLNLAVAAGIALEHLTRNGRSRGILAAPPPQT
jgi:tRNA G18 (ribose-2'-O)-methylase SpoU